MASALLFCLEIKERQQNTWVGLPSALYLRQRSPAVCFLHRAASRGMPAPFHVSKRRRDKSTGSWRNIELLDSFSANEKKRAPLRSLF
ncbi:hypothetical protein EEX84_01500 [Planococcus salinus]|uniref:Uncharacterized protein n=1 Tax=Planococcus salinus TaxID=1848460 RepID=A0A3M8PBI3_9BACL|nr:hypothetical protein EEX84_01500 [Planococcus salinus]